MYDELVKRLRDLQVLTEHCDEQSCFDCENRELCDKHDNKTLSGTYKEAADAIEELSKPRWIPVTERLPESSGGYIVYLRPFKGKTDRGYMIGDLSYPTEMYFDKGQMLWVYENESYNAILSAVDTENEYHVTHWMLLPQPPEEGET